MNFSSDFDVRKMLNIFYVRKGIVLTVFFVIFSLGAYLAVSLPDIYRSSTLILITPQKLPSSFVSSQTAWSIEQRVRTISQDILSRARIGKIVEEFNLYPTLGSIDTRIDRLRRNMVIDVRRNDTFALSFEHRTPEKAMQVASRIGSLFVEENVNLSEEQREGTSSFINTEAQRLRKELEEQEAGLNLYRAQHRFELPEQLDANLRTIEQLRNEFQGNTLRLSSLQERKSNLEKQLLEANVIVPRGTQGQQSLPEWRQLEDRRQQLDDLRIRYSDKHPDVVRLKNEIQKLEAEEKAWRDKMKGSSPAENDQARNPVQQMLLKQVAELNAEINSLRSTNDTVRGQIASYQARIDNTPVRAIDLAKITRSYDVTLKKYQDLQAKSFDTRLSENMEKSQKGEQFRVIDKPNLPQQPVGPNRIRILLVALVVALGGGFGAAFLRENMDGSFKSGEEIREHTTVPLLATIPAIATRETILQQRRTQGILVLASAVILVVGIASIHFYGTLYF